MKPQGSLCCMDHKRIMEEFRDRFYLYPTQVMKIAQTTVREWEEWMDGEDENLIRILPSMYFTLQCLWSEAKVVHLLVWLPFHNEHPPNDLVEILVGRKTDHHTVTVFLDWDFIPHWSNKFVVTHTAEGFVFE